MLPFPASLDLTLPNTPIIEIGAISNSHLWLKRDDLTGIELSGNKIRKLDFLIQEAIEAESEGIITCGGLQSNHCRAAAYAALQVGLKPILYLRGNPEEQPSGNHFLSLLAGATIHYVTPEEYLDIDSMMSKKSDELSNEGRNYYVIPEGGSNEVGAWGYIKCFCEILEQIKNQNLQIDAITVSTGSGGTHAGLLLGKILTESSIDVLSVNVCDDADFFKTKILDIMRRFQKKYQLPINFHRDDIHIYDGFTGEGYGLITEKEVAIIKKFIKNEGIVLDPVYTAKAYLGLEQLIKESIIDYNNILFIHTGGVFGVFPHAGQLV